MQYDATIFVTFEMPNIPFKFATPGKDSKTSVAMYFKPAFGECNADQPFQWIVQDQ